MPKRSDKPTGDDNVTPLREGGPLRPRNRKGLGLSIGVEDGDMTAIKPDGTLERTKIEDDDG